MAFQIDDFTLVKQGAEARVHKGMYLGMHCIAKERFVKEYRLPELDGSLTKERIKAEVKAIVKCRSLGIKTPTLFLVDLQLRTIFMEYLQNTLTAKEFIFKASKESIENLSKEIGRIVAKMHMNHLVHGDLTTSNIMVQNYDKINGFSLAIIDFGLSSTNASAEDKGVDLYVLERALISTHSESNFIFPSILQAYEHEYKNCKEVISKFEEVRARGRKRTMVG